MNLFDSVIAHVKSFGHAIEGEEHKLLNEFVAYLGSDKVVSGFSDSPVVKDFAVSIAPAPVVEAAPEPAPVIEEPAPEPEPSPAPVVETPAPVVEVPAETIVSPEEAPVKE